MEDKLTKMRGGVTLVSQEERKAVEAMYTDTINQWRRRKRMFKDVWDAITENSPKNLKDFKVLCRPCIMLIKSNWKSYCLMVSLFTGGTWYGVR